MHGYFSREAAQARREVRQWVRLIRSTLASYEKVLLTLPAATTPAMLYKRNQIECAVADQLWELFRQISGLLREKVSLPLDRSSEQALICSASRTILPWARLGPAYHALGLAMVMGPPHARFSALRTPSQDHPAGV